MVLKFFISEWQGYGIVDLLFLLFLILLLVSIVTIVPSLLAYKTNNQTPLALPAIGHMHLFVGKLLHQALYQIGKKYGPIVPLKMGSFPIIVVSSPKMAREFLQIHDRKFLARPRSLAVRILFFDKKGSVLSSYGDYYKQMRKLMSLELLTPKRIEDSKHIRASEVSAMICAIKEEGKLNKAVNMSKILSSCTMNIITKMAVGKKACSIRTVKGTQLDDLINEGNALLTSIGVGDLIPQLGWVDTLLGLKGKLEHLHQMLNEVYDNIIEEHKQKKVTSGRTDIVDILLNKELNLSNNTIKDIIQDILGAGTKTTSSALEWALSELLLNTSILKKAQDELDIILGPHGVLEESCLNDLKYLKAIVKETLRLHPPAPILPHKSTEDCIVAGYHISKGTNVLVNVWAIGRDVEAWERPLEFDPERFMGVKVSDFISYPFGLGRRSCPGMMLATRMLEFILAHLLYAFDWKLQQDVKLDMEETHGIALSRASSLYAIVTPRH